MCEKENSHNFQNLQENQIYFNIADKDTSIFVKVRTLEYYKNYYRELFIKELVANKTEVAPETFATKLGNFVLMRSCWARPIFHWSI